jgi:acetyl-CoA acyltransferase
MGLTAEAVAKEFKVSREEQDQFAYNSHQKAIKAIQEGKFENQIVPIDVNIISLMKRKNSNQRICIQTR